jgi:hypothetical protein
MNSLGAFHDIFVKNAQKNYLENQGMLNPSTSFLSNQGTIAPLTVYNYYGLIGKTVSPNIEQSFQPSGQSH